MTNKTAYLRPLMTKNFIFDFPSFFTIKQTSSFTKNDYQKTIADSNSLMKAIMKGAESFWYIEAKKTEQIIGSVHLIYKNKDQTNAKLSITLSSQLSDEQITEIGHRILQLLTDNLSVKEVKLSSKLDVTIDNILLSHYDMDNDKLILKIRGN